LRLADKHKTGDNSQKSIKKRQQGKESANEGSVVEESQTAEGETSQKVSKENPRTQRSDIAVQELSIAYIFSYAM
jgi:hypothetical protein